MLVLGDDQTTREDALIRFFAASDRFATRLLLVI